MKWFALYAAALLVGSVIIGTLVGLLVSWVWETFGVSWGFVVLGTLVAGVVWLDWLGYRQTLDTDKEEW